MYTFRKGILRHYFIVTMIFYLCPMIWGIHVQAAALIYLRKRGAQQKN